MVVEALIHTTDMWLKDRSSDRERSTALVDRLIAFFAELVSNRGIERGLDIIRYAVEAGYLPRWPFAGPEKPAE